MRIERLSVEEGFLAGLDLEFRPGLNVLIGERGTGKTSVIELLRFALGAGWFTEEARTRGHQQALAVLGDGKVAVTLFDGVERFVLTRTAQDDRALRVISQVTVLAQNEIEALGVQAAGRLRLIDRLRVRIETEDTASSVLADLRALTAEIQGLTQDIVSLEERSAALISVPGELEDAIRLQTDLMSSIEATEDERKQLASLQGRHSQLSIRVEALANAKTQVQKYLLAVQAIERSGLQLDEWPSAAGEPDVLDGVRTALRQTADGLASATERLRSSLADIDELGSATSVALKEVEEEARVLRVALNRLQEGAGAITKRVDDLRERKGQLDALVEMRSTRIEGLGKTTQARDAVYDRLDDLRSSRFAARARVADALGSKLGPEIRIDVTRSAETEKYAREIVNSLRGSGLHYNRLAPMLAKELSPLELVRAAETLDTGAISAATDLGEDRALAMLTHLRSSSLADLIAVPIDDGVTMELLDGLEYKSTERLSIGQRCTVVLPMLLALDDAVLIVDQPEDHLDNAYVTTTLVERLRARSPEQQLIFSSHNPNIPVLGEADQVAVMGSDGQRAFKLHQGELDDERTVTYVTSLMEGGEEAFRRRAKFYAQSWE